MTVQVRGSTFPTGANTQNPTAVVPAATAVGDLIVACWFGPAEVATNTPTGLTLTRRGTGATGTSTNNVLGTFTRRAISGDAGTTLTFPANGVTTQAACIVVYYDDAGATVDFDSIAETTGGSYTMPARTTSAAQAFAVGICSVRNSNGTDTWTVPSGYTKIGNNGGTGGSGRSWVLADKHTLVSAGTNIGGGTFVASVGGANSATTSLALSVTASTNRAPTANAGPDQVAITPLSTVTLTGSGSTDPDVGDTLTYAWSQTGGTTVTLSSTTTASPTFTAPSVSGGDTLTFSLTVTDNHGLASTADTVVITVIAPVTPVMVAASGNPGANSTTPSITLPSGIHNSDLILVVIQENNNSATLTGLPTGWSVLSGPNQGGASIAMGWVLRKTGATSDSGATVTLGTLGAAIRWATGAIVLRNCTFDAVSWASATATTTTTNTIPGFTPSANNCLAVLLMNLAGSAGLGPLTTTPPSGWSETLDSSSNYGSSSDVGTYLATRQLYGPAGAAQGSTTAESNINHRAGAFIVTVAPSIGNIAPSADAGPDQSGVIPLSTVTLDGRGSADTDAGDTITYAWTQTSGTTVSLSSATSSTPTFTAPSVSGGDTLVFSLVVTDNHGLASDPDTVSIGISASVIPTVIGTSGNPGSSSNTPSITLPTGISNGDYGLIIIQEGSNSATLTGFTGWTVLSGPNQGGANSAMGWVLGKVCNNTDSGRTLTGTLASTIRWAASAIVVRGGTFDAVTWASATASTTTTNTIPGFTPVAANCLAVLLMNLSGVSGGGPLSTVPPSSGWTEQLDSSSNYGSLNDVGTYIATKGLTGQAGTAQPGNTAESNIAHRAGAFIVTLAPGTGNMLPVARTGPDQIAIDPFATVTLDGSSSTDLDTGDTLTYAWTQTAGTTVTLSSTTAASPTFVAPAGLSGQTLTFSLVVTDNHGGVSAADTVDITVLPHTVFYITMPGAVLKPLRVTVR